MAFQESKGKIEWKVHFKSSRTEVYESLSTDQGRAKFWAEEAIEKDGYIEFYILNYQRYRARILSAIPPRHFKLEYFGTEVAFELLETEDGGTDLILSATTPSEQVKFEMTAGWVSVLMAMKAAVDFGVDLRNHHEDRVWDKGYLDN